MVYKDIHVHSSGSHDEIRFIQEFVKEYCHISSDYKRKRDLQMIMMIHYQILTQGKFYSYDIMIFYNHNSRIIQSLERLEFIESKWREFTSNNPKTFNGRLFRVDDYNILSSKNNLIELQLGNTDYKEFIGTQDPEFINRFGKKYTANPLS